MTTAGTWGSAIEAARVLARPAGLLAGLAWVLSPWSGLGCGGDGVPSDGGTGGVVTSAATADESSTLAHDTASEASTSAMETTGEPDHGALAGLELVPADMVLAVDLGAPAGLTFTVLGRYEDGAVLDLTAAASFELEEPRLGTMDGARLELPAFAETFAGLAHVRATVDGESARARLTIVAHDEAQTLLVLPYEGTAPDPAGPSVPLELDTGFDRLDVVVNVDATGSMGGPIAALQAALVDTVIPGLRSVVADASVGIAAFMDYPIAPFGAAGCDQPFVLLQPVTSSAAAAHAGALGLTDGPFGGPIGCGGDAPASHLEALWQLVSGEGLDGPAPTLVAPSDVGLRDDALPVIVSITGARSHDPAGSTCDGTDYDADPGVLAVAAGRDETETALEGACARVVTMAVSDFAPTCSPLADGMALADATGAVVHPAAWDLALGGRPPECAANQCCTGLDRAGVAPQPGGLCPLVPRVPFSGNGLGERLAEAVALLVRYAPVIVSASIRGTSEGLDGAPLPPGLDTADFIASATPHSAGPTALPGAPPPFLTPYAFVGVVPGTPVAFELVGRNDFVPPTDAPQLFALTVTARADGCIELDAREVLVLVPPESPPS